MGGTATARKRTDGNPRKGAWRSWLVWSLLLTLTGLVALACSSPTGSGGDGHLTLRLTDAPFPYEMVSEANVTISRVDIVSEGGVRTILEDARSFNLLELRDGVTAVLAEADLDPGPYRQVRLIVSSAEVVLTDQRTFDLVVPSGAQTGIKVLLPDFEVTAEGATELTLDFDVEESFVVRGNPETVAGIRGFLFKPVVRPVGLSVEEEQGADDEDETEEEEEEEEEEEGEA